MFFSGKRESNKIMKIRIILQISVLSGLVFSSNAQAFFCSNFFGGSRSAPPPPPPAMTYRQQPQLQYGYYYAVVPQMNAPAGYNQLPSISGPAPRSSRSCFFR